MIKSLLNLLYPIRCPLCGEIVMPKGNLTCQICQNAIHIVQEPKCMKCGKPIDIEETEYCSDCQRKKYHFVRGYSLWVYDERMKKSIGDFKYRNKREYGIYYVEELVKYYGKVITDLDLDAIVPVPLHRAKLRERGYNQAEVIAKGVSKKLDIPLIANLLIRNRKTLPQKQLNDKERLKNLMSAFEYNEKAGNEYSLTNGRFLLVDDIYTTGSTIEACTNVLLQQGAKEVYFLTLCIGKGYGNM